MGNRRVFVSSSREYQALRKEVQLHCKLQVTIQENLGTYGTQTIHKLDRDMCKCDLVLHLVGEHPGSKIEAEILQPFLADHPKFRDLHGVEPDELSFAQIEAYLAIFRGIPLIIAIAKDADLNKVTDVWSQQKHIDVIKGLGRFAEKSFSNANDVNLIIAEWYFDTQGEAANEWVPVADQPSKATDEELTCFFDGATPSWKIAADDRVPMFPAGEEVIHRVTNSMRNTFTLFNGPTAEGKSTILRQIAFRLSQQSDFQVWDFGGSGEIDPAATRDLVMKSRVQHRALIVDDAFQYTRSLAQVMKLLKDVSGVHLLAASRGADWNRMEGAKLSMNEFCDLKRLSFFQFNLASATQLVETWASIGALGKRLEELPPDRRASKLLDKMQQARGEQDEEHSLYGGLLWARYTPRELRNHIKDMISRLGQHDEHLEKAFIAIALAETLDVPGIDPQLLGDLLELPNRTEAHVRKKLQTLGHEASVADLATKDGKRKMFQTRHPQISLAAVQSVIEDHHKELDPEWLLPDMIRSAQSRAGQVAFGSKIIHSSTRVIRKLTGLCDESDRKGHAKQIALTAAKAANEHEHRLALAADLIIVHVRADDKQEAIRIAKRRMETIEQVRDYRASARYFFSAWARAEAGNAGLWLQLYAISDQLDRDKALPVRMRTGDFSHGVQRLHYILKDLGFKGLAECVDNVLPLVEVLLSSEPDTICKWNGSQPKPAKQFRQSLEQVAEKVKAARPKEFGATDNVLTFNTFVDVYDRVTSTNFGPVLEHTPIQLTNDELEFAMVKYCEQERIEPYDAQQLAFQHLANRRNVLLNTPTGTGKSLVGLAAMFFAFCRGEASIYTAPTKALVTEKFFDLRKQFGSRNVGMMTGDVSINHEAPIICCTAEILARLAIIDGAESRYSTVVMDEYHFVFDKVRGSSWLIPIIEMTRARFLLMSATLPDPQAIVKQLKDWNSGEVALVQATKRPVELKFEYFDDETVSSAVSKARAENKGPIFVVCFWKQEAQIVAKEITKMILSVEAKRRVAERRPQIAQAISEHKFNTPFGELLRELLLEGVGVHHGGMLPSYRRIVESLAKSKQGMLEVICGTDTLGVGVNLPLQTIIFKQLWKFDGVGSSLLSESQFHQIAGRAGRKGYYDEGYVWVLAPEYVVENNKRKKKSEKTGKKPTLRKPPPPPFIKWDRKTFEKLCQLKLNPEQPHFALNGLMILYYLQRKGDGLGALKNLIQKVKPDSDHYLEQVDTTCKLWLEQNLVDRQLDGPSGEICYDIKVDVENCIDSPLSIFMQSFVGQLDSASATFALDLLSIAEAILPDQRSILEAQHRKRNPPQKPQQEAENEEESDLPTLFGEDLKLDYPRPLCKEIEASFENWRVSHPGLDYNTPKPKSIAREMLENQLDFYAYVKKYRLDHTESELLYHLTSVYRAINRCLPSWILQLPEVQKMMKWLFGLIKLADDRALFQFERGVGESEEEAEDEAKVEFVTDEELRQQEIAASEDQDEFIELLRSSVARWLTSFRDGRFTEIPLGDQIRLQDLKNFRRGFVKIHTDKIDCGLDAFYSDHFRLLDGSTFQQELCVGGKRTGWFFHGEYNPVATAKNLTLHAKLTSLWSPAKLN